MEGNLLVIFCCEGPSVTLRVQSDLSFDDFKVKLSNKGIPDETIAINMSFKIDQYSECALGNNEDWENMLYLMTMSGTNVVNIKAGNFIESAAVNQSQYVVLESQVASASNTSHLATRTIQNGSRITDIEDRNEPQINLPHNDDKVLLTAPWANYIQGVGQKFEGGVVEFRVKLSKYMLEKGYKFRYVRNTNKQVIAECAKREIHGCQWYINATYTKLNGWFYVRMFSEEHRCPMDVRSDKRLSASIIGLLIVDKVKNDPAVTANEIIDLFKGEYGLNISYKQAWRAIEKAQEYIYGCHVDSYHELKWYLINLKKLNEGSRIEFEEGPIKNKKTGVIQNRFLRAFVSFRAAIEGFSHCRPMLCLDGTFLTGRYGGTLLAATAKDGENGLFPVAFAIVSQENKDNWRWFLLNLLMVIPRERKVIYVSDRNVGLMQLFHYEFTDLQNFYCLQHLKTNLRDRFKGRALHPYVKENIISLFSECARAPTKSIFDQKMSEFKQTGGNVAINFLEGLPLEHWAFAHAPCTRFGEMTSNAAESYNKWILDARDLPITQCVDLIRSQTMEQFHKRRTKAALWSGPLCGDLQKQWDAALKKSRAWNIRRTSKYVFEFLCNPTIVVRLDEKKCDCYKWQFHGYPCSHAIAAIHMSESNMEDYVDSYYFASTYRSSYAGSINPVATILKLTECADIGERVSPPEKVRQPGRPAKRRIPSRGEFVSNKRKYRCKTCGGIGHNSKKCKEPIRG